MKTYISQNWFKIGVFLLAPVLLICFVVFHFHSQKINQDQIIFGWPGTTFTDSGNVSPGSVFVQGTLTGNDVWRMVDSGMLPNSTNNSTMINCTQFDMQCLTYTINQVGENQTSDLPIPSSLSITSWSNFLIVATDGGNSLSCTKTTINIDRKNQMVEWVQEPFTQTDIHCKDSSNTTYKWVIERPQQ